MFSAVTVILAKMVHVVFEGNPAAKLMFVGEAPGTIEERLQRPFVGAAGQLFDKILGAVGIVREECLYYQYC